MAGHWKAWAEALTIYYHDPPSGTILSNRIFDFGDSASSTIYKRKEYHDAEAVEFDLHPTRKFRKDSLSASLTRHVPRISQIYLPILRHLKPPDYLPRKHTNVNTKYASLPRSRRQISTTTESHLDTKKSLPQKGSKKSVREKKNAKKARIVKAKPIDWWVCGPNASLMN